MPCKNHSLIDDGKCDIVNFNDDCNFDGKDCCPNPTAIGDGHCNPANLINACNFDGGDCCLHANIADGICNKENLNRMCRYDGGDCCTNHTVLNGICDVGNLNHWCNSEEEWLDCTCDYQNLTRDGHCNVANNKTNCLFDDFDCLCTNATLIDGLYIDCEGCVIICKIFS